MTSPQRPASSNTLNRPAAIAVDPLNGKVYIADASNNRVLRFASLANLSNGAAAEAVLGQPDFTMSTPATTATGLSTPFGLTVDGNGTLWVGDTLNNRVLRFANAAAKANGAAADGVLGQPDFVSSDPATTATGMNIPIGLTVDGSGTLWVAEAGNNRVLRFANAAAKANGAAADGVLGQPDFVSSDPTTTATGMSGSSGVAVDASGTLWVVERSNNRVLRFANAAAKANGAAADGVLGQPDFVSSGSATTATGMNGSNGVAVDAIGTLWVADRFNNRVLRFANAAGKTNGAVADGVLGQPDFTTNSNATTATGMSSLTGVAVDASGTLWVADRSNNRALHFGPLSSDSVYYISLISR